MRNIYNIFIKELKSYFYSPTAYIIIAVFVAITSWLMVSMIENFVSLGPRYMMFVAQGQSVDNFNFNSYVINNWMSTILFILILLLPFLTMRLMAEEKNNNTYLLLMTSPIKYSHIIFGKFFAVSFVLILALMISSLFIPFSALYTKIDYLTIFIGYLGILLLGAGIISVGFFFSSITNSQIIAALLTFGISLILWIILWAAEKVFIGGASQVLVYLSLQEHLRSFIEGTIDTRDIVYFISFIAIFIFLLYQSMKIYSRR